YPQGSPVVSSAHLGDERWPQNRNAGDTSRRALLPGPLVWGWSWAHWTLSPSAGFVVTVGNHGGHREVCGNPIPAIILSRGSNEVSQSHRFRAYQCDGGRFH